MNKPITAKRVLDASRASTTERSEVGRVATDPAPRRKPTGPMIYQVEKGADVWPVRKQGAGA